MHSARRKIQRHHPPLRLCRLTRPCRPTHPALRLLNRSLRHRQMWHHPLQRPPLRHQRSPSPHRPKHRGIGHVTKSVWLCEALNACSPTLLTNPTPWLTPGPTPTPSADATSLEPTAPPTMQATASSVALLTRPPTRLHTSDPTALPHTPAPVSPGNPPATANPAFAPTPVRCPGRPPCADHGRCDSVTGKCYCQAGWYAPQLHSIGPRWSCSVAPAGTSRTVRSTW